jgi:hypothetical protein
MADTDQALLAGLTALSKELGVYIVEGFLIREPPYAGQEGWIFERYVPRNLNEFEPIFVKPPEQES